MDNFETQANLALKNTPYYKRLQQKVKRLTHNLQVFTKDNINEKIKAIKSDISKLETKLELAMTDLTKYLERKKEMQQALDDEKKKLRDWCKVKLRRMRDLVEEDEGESSTIEKEAASDEDESS